MAAKQVKADAWLTRMFELLVEHVDGYDERKEIMDHALTAFDTPKYKPAAWYTEDHLSDKSATTWDQNVAARWLSKGWPVSTLFVQDPDSDVEQVDDQSSKKTMPSADFQGHRNLAPHEPVRVGTRIQEPHGVIVCAKNVPNAIETFIPYRFYIEAAWPDSEYSKVPVFKQPQESVVGGGGISNANWKAFAQPLALQTPSESSDDICPVCGGSGEGGEVYIGEECYEGPCHFCGGTGSVKPKPNIETAHETFSRKYEYDLDMVKLPSGAYASKETNDALWKFLSGWNSGFKYATDRKMEAWTRLASIMYQAAGEYNMPVRFLDALDRAQENESFEHLLDSLLPVSKDEDGIWAKDK